MGQPDDELQVPLLAPSTPGGASSIRTPRSIQPSPSYKELATAYVASDHGQRTLTLLGLGTIISVALGFGLLLPPNPALPLPYGYISAVVGWAYFACWSISFYPQIYHNWKRQSVQGLSFDFTVYNLLGFGCYSIFNCALYFSEKMKAAYAQRHGGASSPVEANDVFFSLHAFAATLITAAQCIAYERGGQRVSEICKLLTALALVGGASYGVFILIANHWCSCYSIFPWLYLCSYVKLAVTLFKYMPQIHLNYVRKSTVGWSISNCLLDIGGGCLSMGQLFADSHVKNDWSAVTGNPVKFGLGMVSMVADVIIMVQHYLLYPAPASDDNSHSFGYGKIDGTQPLLIVV